MVSPLEVAPDAQPVGGLPAHRAECLRCRRPRPLCLCPFIQRVANRTGITVVQHPRERTHPVGTARFVELGLTGARVVSPVHADRSLAAEVVLPAGAAVLFPSDTARELSTLSPEDRPTHLVVLDGTWHHARRLHRQNPWIDTLPHVKLLPAAPSRYRIRREPSPDCLSTLEAVVAALTCLEPELEGLDGLLGAFDRMVDQQLVHAEGRGRAPRVRAVTRRAAGRLPRALFERRDDLVLVYAEWAEGGRPTVSPQRRAIQWAAYRLATGDVFEGFCAPTTDEARERARAFELGPEADALPEAEVLASLVEFIGPTGVLAAWDRGTLRPVEASLGVAAQGAAVLKDVYRVVTGNRAGPMEELLAREGLVAAALPLAGRAGLRLGNAVTLARFLAEVGGRAARAPGCVPI